jgi:hypothetical protein
MGWKPFLNIVQQNIAEKEIPHPKRVRVDFVDIGYSYWGFSPPYYCKQEIPDILFAKSVGGRYTGN